MMKKINVILKNGMEADKKPVSEKLQAWRDKRNAERQHENQLPAHNDLIKNCIAQLPISCLQSDDVCSDLSPSDCLKLCKVMLEYIRSSPTCFSESDFLLDCTGYAGGFLKDRFADTDKWIELQAEERGKKAIKNAHRLYRRARELCERHLVQIHAVNNPTFAEKYAQNKFGWTTKNESKSEVNKSGRIDIIMHMPIPQMPKNGVLPSFDPQQTVGSNPENSINIISE